MVGHGLDPLYEHVATEWKDFCQQDDTEKRKYSALWYINTSYFYILYISNGSRSIARYGSSGYNRVGAEAVARFAICSLGQKTGGNGPILPGQKEEMESRIRLSRWKVDTRINLVDLFQGGF